MALQFTYTLPGRGYFKYHMPKRHWTWHADASRVWVCIIYQI